MNQLTEIQNRALAAKMGVEPSGEATATRAAAVLVGGYGNLQVHDVRAFTDHLIRLMSQYPADLCMKAAQEIPQLERYLNVAAVREWLEERMADRRREYGVALEARQRAEREAKEREHRESVERDKAAFVAWEKEHPGGNMRQFLGLAPYPAPSKESAEYEPWEIGPWKAAGHLAAQIEGDTHD
jgi:hypothetical protein